MTMSAVKTESSGTEGAARLLEGRNALRLLAVAALAAVIVHFVALESAPPGLYVDEASFGYNAYSILRTGADEGGVRMPLYFRAFGEYKSPLFTYALVPLIAVLGPTPLAVRLGATVFGLATALFVALVVREGTGRRGLAWLAFVLTAVVPWLFTPARCGFASVALPCTIAAAWWAWLVALRTRRLLAFAASWSAWTLAFYSYSPGRLIAPLLAVLLIVVSGRRLNGMRIRCAVASLPFVVGVGAAVRWMAANPGALTGRLHVIAGWQEGAGLAGQVLEVAARYVGYFSPRFLFTHGDSILRHHTGFGGELFLFMMPLLVVGVVVAVRRRDTLSAFALAGFLSFPIAASLTDSPTHALRTLSAVPFVIVLTIVGTSAALDFLSNHPRIVAAGFGIAALEAGIFLYDFFARYPRRAATWFDSGLVEAVQAARATQRGDLYFSRDAFRDENGNVNQPYILFAYLGALDPALFQHGGLAAFHIYPLDPTVSPPRGSLLLVKDGDELFTASGRPVPLPRPLHLPVGARTVAEFPTYPRRSVPGPTYRLIRIQ